MFDRAAVLKELNTLDIAFDLVEHDPVFTVEQVEKLSIQFRGIPCKNLFVKDKDGKKFLLVIPCNDRADLKSIASKIQSKRLSFCSSDELIRDLGVTPGSASPLAIINNTAKDVNLVIDKSIMDGGFIACHPLDNAATVTLSADDLRKFVSHNGHDFNVLELV